ncbi:response regulator [Niabella sp. CC-SYL272]|uniref:response regulator n=1 Tax=Niabella agricola TaxID=2891571 RepID=UPI001F36B0A3|nr:response regulator [Niabella agricola]MCF3110888.1 response regulator [Niabella agricola]
MIKKVLIAEDHESVSISIQKTLEALHMDQIDHVYYCDDALMKIQEARQQHHSYDILITDLYFEKDHRDQQIDNGATLIAAARKAQPDLKVLVFSAESKAAIIETLFDQLEIDGYVRKARGDARELKKALEHIKAGQRYYPRHLLQQVKQVNHYAFTPLDITIIALMTQGKRQQEIADHLKKSKIQPSSLSSIEKRLTLMKDALNFSTNEQLIAYCVKLGVV